MERLAKLVKPLIPANVRRSLRAAHRLIVFRRAMRRFQADPESSLEPGNKLLAHLIYGWGNAAWSAQEEYLAACVRHALISPGPFLECGSGLSTLLIGAIAEQRGRAHWVLEHNGDWAARVIRHLRRYNLEVVVLCREPLKNYGEFFWYDVPFESMPDDFFSCDLRWAAVGDGGRSIWIGPGNEATLCF